MDQKKAECVPNPFRLFITRGRRHLAWFISSLVGNQCCHLWPRDFWLRSHCFVAHWVNHSDGTMSAMASEITCVSIVYHRLFRPRLDKSSKLRVTGLYEGNSPVTGEFSAQRASNAENVPFDDVIITRLSTRCCAGRLEILFLDMVINARCHIRNFYLNTFHPRNVIFLIKRELIHGYFRLHGIVVVHKFPQNRHRHRITKYTQLFTMWPDKTCHMLGRVTNCISTQSCWIFHIHWNASLLILWSIWK